MDHVKLNRLKDLAYQLRYDDVSPADREAMFDLVNDAVTELAAVELLPDAVDDLRRLLDVLTPVDELERRLRLTEQRLRPLVDVILEAASRLVTTEEDRGTIADFLTSHVEGEHRLVDAAGDARGRWPGWDERPPVPDGPEVEITEPDHDRFWVGAHDDSIRCKGDSCGARLSLDREAGVWRGRHWRSCSIAGST